VSWVLLPTGLLGQVALLPPQRFWLFLVGALGTYVILGVMAAPLTASISRVVGIGRDGNVSAFLAGFFLTLAGLSASDVVVWTAMSVTGLFYSGPSLLRCAQNALIVVLVLAFPYWMATRLIRSLRAAVWGLAVILPSAMTMAALVAHAQIEYPLAPVVREHKNGLPNIIFVTIDTVRADFIGSYCGGCVSTPTLDRLAAEGVRFDMAISQVPTTTPSHVSIFTSTYPFVHRAKNGLPMRTNLRTLPGEFKEIGYRTAAFTSAYTTLSAVTGLGPSFDTYVDSLSPYSPFLLSHELQPLFPYRLLDRLSGNQIRGAVVNARVSRWLDEPPSQPFFVWIHYFDAHAPYDAPPEYEGKYERPLDTSTQRSVAKYKAALSYLDAQLGEFFGALRRHGLQDDCIIVVIADHGEAFLEPHPDSERDDKHGRHLYDSVLRIPLIMWGPKWLPAGRVVFDQIQSIDVAPTLLQLLGVRIPSSFMGRSLSPLLSGDHTWAEYAFSQTANLSGRRLFSIRSRKWKLIIDAENNREELFDLEHDSGENKNLARSNGKVVAEYLAKLNEVMSVDSSGYPPNRVLDPEAIRRLRALGYIY
jgi:arylsulfatase A-like enzyme